MSFCGIEKVGGRHEVVLPGGVDTMDTYTEERRRHPRLDVETNAWLLFAHEDAARVTTTVDLSPDGAQLSGARPVDVDTPLLLNLQLDPNARSLECKASIRCCRAVGVGLYRYGVRFLDLLEDERDQLRQYLDANLDPAPC